MRIVSSVFLSVHYSSQRRQPGSTGYEWKILCHLFVPYGRGTVPYGRGTFKLRRIFTLDPLDPPRTSTTESHSGPKIYIFQHASTFPAMKVVVGNGIKIKFKIKILGKFGRSWLLIILSLPLRFYFCKGADARECYKSTGSAMTKFVSFVSAAERFLIRSLPLLLS